jgi:hypothetical protein
MRFRFASLVAALGAAMVVASGSDARAQPASSPGSGLALFATSYAYAAIMGTAVYRNDSGQPLWESLIPVAGPYIALKSLNSDSLVGGRIAQGGWINDGKFWAGLYVDMFEVVAFALAPIGQVIGLATAAGGLAAHPRLGRAAASAPTWAFGAMPMRGGGARFTVSVTTW